MPQTRMIAKYINRMKLPLLIGTSLGWGYLAAEKKDSGKISAYTSIYNSKSLNLTNSSDFKQHLLEIRLNDLSLKYCAENEAPVISVEVKRKTVSENILSEDDEILSGPKFPKANLLFFPANKIGAAVFVYAAPYNLERLKNEETQKILNKTINNTTQIETALRQRLWQYILLEKIKQNGISGDDISPLTIIDIIHIHDAFKRSVLEQELIEQREVYLKTKDINAINDKFLFYKRALRDRKIAPRKDDIGNVELTLIANGIQQIYNESSPQKEIESRIKFIRFVRPKFYGEHIKPHHDSPQKLQSIFKICSEHKISGKKVDLSNFRQVQNEIASETISMLRECPKISFNQADEKALNAYVYQDNKQELQETVVEIKEAFLQYYKDNKYLKK